MAVTARIENGVVFSPYPSEAVPEISLYQLVKQCLEQHGNRTAVVCGDEDITFPELLKMFQRYAAGFQRYGVKKEEKVLVHLDNSLENMIAMYSVIFAGGVVVSSSTFLSNGEYSIRSGFGQKQRLNASIMDERRDNQTIKRLKGANKTGRKKTHATDPPSSLDVLHVLCFQGYFVIGTAPGFVSVADFKKLNENSYQTPTVDDVKNEAVVLFYTSGTTGRPKAVEHTHYSIVATLPRPR
ncbi:unnamed protein product [Ixodes hexagonus]